MDSIFRRKEKHRARQSSQSSQDVGGVPYNKLSQSAASPIPVATLGPNLRQSSGSVNISAPVTNPTLTNEGTDLNYGHPRKAIVSGSARMEMPIPEPYRPNGYNSNSSMNPGSPPTQGNTSWGGSTQPFPVERSTSSSTVASSRASNRSDASSKVSGIMATPSRTRRTTGSTENPSIVASPRQGTSATIRPASNASKTDYRLSGYAPSTSSTTSDSHHSYHSHHSHHSGISRLLHRDEERPPPEELDQMFYEVLQARGMSDGDMGNMDADMRWRLVQEHRRMEGRSSRRAVVAGPGQVGPPEQGSPEWYLKKLVDGTITSRDVSGLGVSLRTGSIP